MNFSLPAIIILKRPYSKCTADCNEALSKDLVQSYLIQSRGTLNYLTRRAAALWVSLIFLRCLCNGTKLGWDNARACRQAPRPHPSVQEVGCAHSSALLPSAGLTWTRSSGCRRRADRQLRTTRLLGNVTEGQDILLAQRADLLSFLSEAFLCRKRTLAKPPAVFNHNPVLPKVKCLTQEDIGNISRWLILQEFRGFKEVTILPLTSSYYSCMFGMMWRYIWVFA